MTRRRPTQQELVEAAFEARVLMQPGFSDATLVRKVDEDSGEAPLQTHRIYRTATGAYFVFICTAGQSGFLSFLTRERAENALRSSPEIFQKEFGSEQTNQTLGLGPMNLRLIAALLGVFLLCVALLSVAKPTLCATGCGNLLEPLFQAAYYFFGSWGIRGLLLALAGLMFWVAIRGRE